VPPPARLGCFVIHNKQREKAAQLPEGVPQIVGQVRCACCALLCSGFGLDWLPRRPLGPAA